MKQPSARKVVSERFGAAAPASAAKDSPERRTAEADVGPEQSETSDSRSEDQPTLERSPSSPIPEAPPEASAYSAAKASAPSPMSLAAGSSDSVAMMEQPLA